MNRQDLIDLAVRIVSRPGYSEYDFISSDHATLAGLSVDYAQVRSTFARLSTWRRNQPATDTPRKRPPFSLAYVGNTETTRPRT